MMEFLSHYGYGALFGLSFLASTLLPVGSEWLMVAMVIKGFDPIFSVSLATAGNTLGACTTYGIGFYGSAWVIQNLLRMDARSRMRAERFYTRFGVWSLLFSWLPIVGDPLCLAGGLLRVHFGVFLLLVSLGKLVRYGLLAYLVLPS